MSKCGYCGKEYPDDQELCSTDGTPLARKGDLRTEPPIQDQDRPPSLINLHDLEGAFVFQDGFSRPDWQIIRDAIQQQVSSSLELHQAWNEAARQWIAQIRTDLGGDYHLSESRQFILLAALEESIREDVLSSAERTLGQIEQCLKDAAWKSKLGKHVILLFADEDDYYQYVSYYVPEGIHPMSGGCLIHRGGYVHIAAPYDPRNLHATLAHELTHNCLTHLHLPLWLNEGLSTRVQRSVMRSNTPILDGEMKDRHISFWNERTIQEFWAGVSFHKPGESNALSYNLAEILVTVLSDCKGDWIAFLKQAHWADAGQTSAIENLETDLGKTISNFLGAGDWRPRLKTLWALWEEQRKSGPLESSDS